MSIIIFMFRITSQTDRIVINTLYSIGKKINTLYSIGKKIKSRKKTLELI